LGIESLGSISVIANMEVRGIVDFIHHTIKNCIRASFCSRSTLCFIFFRDL